MADTPASPGTPTPPIPTAPAAPANESTVSRQTQLAAIALLLIIAGLIGWRWYADRFRTRPSELQANTAHRIDINKASKSELLQIPGVGPQLAERIVSERESKGRFNSVDDLNRVHGIGDATVNKIRPWVKIEAGDEPPKTEPDRLVRKPAAKELATKNPGSGLININTATLAELQSLPNIGPVLAQRIIAEREKKPFANVDEVRRVSGIGPKRLDAIRGLVNVGE